MLAERLTTGRSTTFQSGIGVPYILMSKAPGIPLSTFRWQTACHNRARPSGPKDSGRALTQNERSKIMEQLGRLMAQLSLLRFPTIGSLFEQDAGEYVIEECLSPGYVLHGRDELDGIERGPFSEDREHFSSLVSAFRSQAEDLPMGYHILLAPTPAPQEYRSFAEFYTAQTLWNDYAAVGDKTESSSNRLAYCIAASYLQEQVVPYPGVSRSNQGGFPLYHHDLSTQNIFVDEHFNITCIIDWAFASTVPHAQLYATPGLPHPRDLVTDQRLVDAFRSTFTDNGESPSTMAPGGAPEATHWNVGEAVSRFMLLVRFDALQDYPLLEELHTIIQAHTTSEKKSLQGSLVEISTKPEILDLAEALKSEDEPESDVKRHESQYFNAVGQDRFVLAQKITELSQHEPFFVLKRDVWAGLISRCSNTKSLAIADAKRSMSMLQPGTVSVLIDALGRQGLDIRLNRT